jgi:hypothetical protein
MLFFGLRVLLSLRFSKGHITDYLEGKVRLAQIGRLAVCYGEGEVSKSTTGREKRGQK